MKERLEFEKRRIEAQRGREPSPLPAGSAMDAESMLAMMERAEELKRKKAEEAANRKKAEAAVDAIRAIGKVRYAPECRDRIAAAKCAYYSLTAEQRALVHNANDLSAAEREYRKAKAEEERKRREVEEREMAIEAVFAMKVLPSGGASVQGLLDKDATEVTIPERYRDHPVTSIGFKAFSGCSKLKSIAIPSTVESIGELAFAGCHGLTALFLPSSVKTIVLYVKDFYAREVRLFSKDA